MSAQSDRYFETYTANVFDPGNVPDTFASGVGYVEEVSDGVYRLCLVSERRDPQGRGSTSEVVAQIVATSETLATIGRASAQTVRVGPELLSLSNDVRPN